MNDILVLKDNRWYCPSSDQSCYEWTIGEGYIPQLLMETLHELKIPLKNVIHAGGNIGIYAHQYSEKFENVYVFEPEWNNYRALSLNLINCTNIFPFRAALGNVNQPIRLENEDPANTNIGTWRVCGNGNIPSIQIDDLGLKDVSLLHLDVEGHELFALQGAQKTISRCSPLIAVETIGHFERYGYSEEDIHRFLFGLGYTHWRKYAHETMFFKGICHEQN